MLKSFKPNAHNVKAIDFYHVLCLSLCCGAEADGKVNVKLSTYSHPHHSPFTMQSVFPFCTAARRKSAKTLIEQLCTSNLLIKKSLVWNAVIIKCMFRKSGTVQGNRPVFENCLNRDWKDDLMALREKFGDHQSPWSHGRLIPLSY